MTYMEEPEDVRQQSVEAEVDWLPEETKQRVRRRPDYMQNNPPCEACQ